MRGIHRSFQTLFTGAVLLTVGAWSLFAAETKPEFKEAVYFGGSGDQGMGDQGGLGLDVREKGVYLCGLDRALYGGQALLVKYASPPGSSPVWSLRWPNKKASGHFNSEVFCGVAATEEGVYCAGRSWLEAVDTVGDKEHKGILVKFPLSGATGPATGGALWMAKPNFFPYTGNESLLCVTAAQEGGATYLYAGGYAQSRGDNNTAVLMKCDTQGKILWTKVLGDPTVWYKWSQSDAVVVFNGSVYVAGYTHYPTSNPVIRPHTGLWKLDSAGNILWSRFSTEPIRQDARITVGLAASEKHLYVASTQEKGPNGGFDVLVLKYDESGNLIWSKVWGGTKDDTCYGISLLGDRLYLVGDTLSWVGGAKDAFLLEMDAETGEVLSVNHHGGTGDDTAIDAQAYGSHLIVAGQTRSFQEGGNGAGQSDLMLLRYLLKLTEPPILQVSIDIHPGSFPNPINLKSKGKVPVAILSTAEWSAPAEVDPKSVTFGRTGTEPCLAASGCKPEDVDRDGLVDLICHFETDRTGFQAGDVQGTLRGKLRSGRLFMGVDSIVIHAPEAPKPEPPKKEKRAVETPGKKIQPTPRSRQSQPKGSEVPPGVAY